MTALMETRHWPGRSPLRVVLSRNLSIPQNLNLLTDGHPTIVYNAVKDETCGAVEYVKLDTTNPQSWLEDLYRRSITSVMVEGGTQLLQGLIAAGTWDEARIEVSPRRVGQGVKAPVINGHQSSQYLIDGNTITYLTRTPSSMS